MLARPYYLLIPYYRKLNNDPVVRVKNIYKKHFECQINHTPHRVNNLLIAVPKDPEIRSSFVSPFRPVLEGVIFIRKLLVVSRLEARSCVERLLARRTGGRRVCTTGDDIPRRKTTSWWRAVASKFPCKTELRFMLG